MADCLCSLIRSRGFLTAQRAGTEDAQAKRLFEKCAGAVVDQLTAYAVPVPQKHLRGGPKRLLQNTPLRAGNLVQRNFDARVSGACIQRGERLCKPLYCAFLVLQVEALAQFATEAGTLVPFERVLERKENR